MIPWELPALITVIVLMITRKAWPSSRRGRIGLSLWIGGFIVGIWVFWFYFGRGL